MPSWRCPEDGGRLDFDGNGALRCAGGHSYAIDRDIPRFARSSTYVDHFGLQWNVYDKTQLDSYTGVPITRNRLKHAMGSDLWDSLSGKSVLECGCGAGRFSEVLLDTGAFVTSVDLSNAVNANARQFPISRNHRVAQADILKLPFADQAFDVVLCLGVIQHTPNPEETIRQLYRFVKPGGLLVIDHYALTWRRFSNVAPLVREVLIRMPADRALKVTNALVNFFLPWHKRFAKKRFLNMLLSRISPLRCYYREYPELPDRLQYEWSLLDTHDSLTDWYKHLRSRAAIRRSLEGLGMSNIWCEYGGNGVVARAERPN